MLVYISAFIPRRRSIHQSDAVENYYVNIRVRRYDSVADNEPRQFAITNISTPRHRGYQIASRRLRVASLEPITRGLFNLVIVIIPSNSKRRVSRFDSAIYCLSNLPQNSIRHDMRFSTVFLAVTWSFRW